MLLIVSENNLLEKELMLFLREALGKYLINGGPPKNNRRKNVVYKITCETCNFCCIGETSQWFDERETQHKRSVKNCDSKQWHLYAHFKTSRSCNSMGHSNVSRLWQKFQCEEDERIVLYFKSLELWIWKMECWRTNAGMPSCQYYVEKFLRKTKLTVKNICVLAFFSFFEEKVIPKGHI